MKTVSGIRLIATCLMLWLCVFQRGSRADAKVLFAGERSRSNFVSELLEVASISSSGNSFTITRRSDGWIFIATTCQGNGTVDVFLDDSPKSDALIRYRATARNPVEGVRFVKKGAHRIHVDCSASARVDRLVVKAIPELIHSGLGYDPAIKSFGHYDMAFLERDILPNVTTLIVPHNIKLPQPMIDDWHRQGKRFIAEVGVSSTANTADEHAAYWSGLLDTVPFADGIIIDEFIINRPSSRTARTPRNPPAGSPRSSRRAEEQEKYQAYEKALKQLRANSRHKDKRVYAYFGGSGNTLNEEIIGPTFIRTIRECGYRIALERYIFERSSEERSRDALRLFVEGIADWNAREPGVNRDMIVTFGLFSMPPGGINKLPNVDYHVWMDQQMHVAANDPLMAGISGLNWWTTLLADEETVRFVGKLYRHYAIEGKTEMLTHDPLFLTHLQNADFERGTADWNLHAAEAGSIQAKSFPRYGRIEMRYMGLGRPPDPEHIGDTFLWMKRSAKGPNTFSQTAKNLEPGRWYTLEMFSCDYQDLVLPKAKTVEQANKFIGTVTIDGVEIDRKHSFTEMYPTGPEPKIPVWITYHWTVFKALGPTAKLTVSDWAPGTKPGAPSGQEQIFNFLELQPYHN
ncbi:MAG TPA: hypothetical protein VGP76_16880 [Planctomycetaceae bacterium]|nr:hypothetical protein [Planctomycetaceae bacterium]